jgi:hypothetical protein
MAQVTIITDIEDALTRERAAQKRLDGAIDAYARELEGGVPDVQAALGRFVGSIAELEGALQRLAQNYAEDRIARARDMAALEALRVAYTAEFDEILPSFKERVEADFKVVQDHGSVADKERRDVTLAAALDKVEAANETVKAMFQAQVNALAEEAAAGSPEDAARARALLQEKMGAMRLTLKHLTETYTEEKLKRLNPNVSQNVADALEYRKQFGVDMNVAIDQFVDEVAPAQLGWRRLAAPASADVELSDTYAGLIVDIQNLIRFYREHEAYRKIRVATESFMAVAGEFSLNRAARDWSAELEGLRSYADIRRALVSAAQRDDADVIEALVPRLAATVDESDDGASLARVRAAFSEAAARAQPGSETERGLAEVVGALSEAKEVKVKKAGIGTRLMGKVSVIARDEEIERQLRALDRAREDLEIKHAKVHEKADDARAKKAGKGSGDSAAAMDIPRNLAGFEALRDAVIDAAAAGDAAYFERLSAAMPDLLEAYEGLGVGGGGAAAMIPTSTWSVASDEARRGGYAELADDITAYSGPLRRGHGSLAAVQLTQAISKGDVEEVQQILGRQPDLEPSDMLALENAAKKAPKNGQEIVGILQAYGKKQPSGASVLGNGGTNHWALVLAVNTADLAGVRALLEAPRAGAAILSEEHLEEAALRARELHFDAAWRAISRAYAARASAAATLPDVIAAGLALEASAGGLDADDIAALSGGKRELKALYYAISDDLDPSRPSKDKAVQVLTMYKERLSDRELQEARDFASKHGHHNADAFIGNILRERRAGAPPGRLAAGAPLEDDYVRGLAPSTGSSGAASAAAPAPAPGNGGNRNPKSLRRVESLERITADVIRGINAATSDEDAAQVIRATLTTWIDAYGVGALERGRVTASEIDVATERILTALKSANYLHGEAQQELLDQKDRF